MKIDKKALIISIAIPLLVGALSGFISSGSMAQFGQLNKPPLAPPGILFPIVWTILYTLMGISSYLVYENSSGEQRRQALAIYGLQLIVNLLWSVFFFVAEWYLFSFFWLIMLWVLIIRMIKEFYEISVAAAYLNIPYLLWVTFAGYLNLAIYILNK